jgi:hypothetical protein
MKKFVMISAAAALIVSVVGQGSAIASTVPAKQAPASLVQTTPTLEAVSRSEIRVAHGWHRQCAQGYGGWHYHTRWQGWVPCNPYGGGGGGY